MDSRCYWRMSLAYILGFWLSIASCLAEKAPHYTFVKPAILAPRTSYFDYIVVGGGPAGCALAATLSNRSRVLLLERGGVPYGNKNVEDIGSFGANVANNSPTSPSQGFVSKDGVRNTRARVLGGGSSINAGFYTRAPPDYVINVGWDYELVNKSYAWVEEKVANKPQMLQFQTAVKDGLLQAGVTPYNGFTYDHIPGTKFGGTIFDKNGHRHTAADLLEYADPRRTTVYLYAVAQKILFTPDAKLRKPRAFGVIFKDSAGIQHRAYLRPSAKNEVILSAGALGSPQLLMLSGIGPAAELAYHGIDVVLDQPQVGQGMSDNPMNMILIPSLGEVETSLIETVGITEFGSFIEAASGSINMRGFMPNLASAAEMMTSKAQSSGGPQVITTQADLDRAIEYVHSILNGTINGGCILQKIEGPKSSGYMNLTTLDPNDTPTVKFNYFKDPEDLEKCVRGMRTIIEVIESQPFSKFRVPGMTVQSLINIMANLHLNLRPRNIYTTRSLEKFCIDTVLTIWHYHGGCQVNKVVDKYYKVLGTLGLRVVDGSTFYDSPGTNPQATVMMLGRYVGQRILAERQ